MPRARARLSPARGRWPRDPPRPEASSPLRSSCPMRPGIMAGGPILVRSSWPMVGVTETPEAMAVRGAPMPPHGGPVALWRFARRNGMLNLKYARLGLRWARLKLRWRGRLQTDGLCFVAPDVTLEIGRDAVLRLGRWSWIGHGTKIRVHEGEVR